MDAALRMPRQISNAWRRSTSSARWLAEETYYASVVMPGKVFQRARQVQEVLTQRGRHRSAGPVDLLVAATAELTSRTLLHYDRGFETVAQATGQPAQWLAPAGSID